MDKFLRDVGDSLVPYDGMPLAMWAEAGGCGGWLDGWWSETCDQQLVWWPDREAVLAFCRRAGVALPADILAGGETCHVSSNGITLWPGGRPRVSVGYPIPSEYLYSLWT